MEIFYQWDCYLKEHKDTSEYNKIISTHNIMGFDEW